MYFNYPNVPALVLDQLLAELGIEPGYYQSVDEIECATTYQKTLPWDELTIDEKWVIKSWEVMKATAIDRID